MKDRKRLRLLSAVLAVECLVVAYPRLEALGGPPRLRRHVLVLSVDTLRPDYLSASGYDRPTTPFIDSLMAEGFRFTHAMTPIARTTQALSSLMTGCYPHTTRVRNLGGWLPNDFVTVAQLVRRKGYATVAVVSNPVLAKGHGLDNGFDVFDAAGSDRDAAATTDAVLRHLEMHGPEEALFVWAHYVDPHYPYHPQPELAVRFDPDYDGPYKLHFSDDIGPTDPPKEQAVYRNHLPDRVNAHIRRLYAAEIRYTDDNVTRLVKELRRRFGDDWLIVFTADHGESLGEHDYFYAHGDYVTDQELHVPLAFVFPPGDPLRRAGAADARVSLVDVMPTLMQLLDLPRPLYLGYPIEGRTLDPYFLGQSPPPQPVFGESGKAYFPNLVRRRVRFGVAGRFRAVLIDDWKLVWTPGRAGDDQFELYNLSADPGETQNVYGSNRAAAASLKAALTQWYQGESVVEKEAALSAGDLEILRSLGYTR